MKYQIRRTITVCAGLIRGVIAESEHGDWPKSPGKPSIEFVPGDRHEIKCIEPGYNKDKTLTLIHKLDGAHWYQGPFTEGLIKEVRMLRHIHSEISKMPDYDALIRDVFSYFRKQVPAPYRHPHSGRISWHDGNLLISLVYQ